MTALRLGRHAVALKVGVPLVAAYLALYIMLDWVSFIDPIGPLNITPWNPPPGLSLFLLLRFGLRMTPWLFVAALLAEVLVRGVPAPWPVLVVACLLVTAGYAGVAALLRGRLRFQSDFATLRDATVFTGVVVAASFIIAVLYIALFAAAGIIPAGTRLHSIAQFWIGDLIGVVVTTPVLLIATRTRRGTPVAPWWETGLQAASILLALLIVFGSGLGGELKLFYLLFVPMIWIAMRRGVAATTGAILLAQIGLIAALLYEGHRPGEVLDFQFLMLALALTGLFLGVAVEERRAAEQRLREKQSELDRSLRAAAASELASTLAHELNQPLSAIALYTRSCQVLLERGDPERELPATMGKVVTEANRAATVVRRLREFVRSGSVRAEPLPPLQLLEGAADGARTPARRHGVIVVVDAAAELPPIAGDRVQLETVLHNLIVNAIDALKARTLGHTVRLSAAADGDGLVRLTVADDGPGVAPEMLATLFQPLSTSKSDGLGLGLAISRTIVEAHGGRLWLDVSATGASFCLTLPSAR